MGVMHVMVTSDRCGILVLQMYAHLFGLVHFMEADLETLSGRGFEVRSGGSLRASLQLATLL